MKFEFGTKAETLSRLRERHFSEAVFCAQMVVPVVDWRRDSAAILDAVMAEFSGAPLVVRSSSSREDGWLHSMAGAFTSVVDVAAEIGAIQAAVETVIASYGGESEGDQVLIQPMVCGVVLSGVVLTRDIETGGPYFVVNYDDMTGRTDTVTGGAESKTVLVHHSRPEAIHSPRIRKIIAAVNEIIATTGCWDLDIEFCVTADQRLYILQVRPLAASRQWLGMDLEQVEAALDGIRTQLSRRMAPVEGVSGRSTILGEMPDWNPAEMIGNAPRPLSLSLYKRLVTDDSWWRARANMGYRAVSQPLLVDYHGRPYIDVRLSLNSFLPADLPAAIADRLVDSQLARLAADPESHDKIEFEIAVTCRDFAFPRHAAQLAQDGFEPEVITEFERRLKQLTARALDGRHQRIAALLERTRGLDGTGGLVHILEQCRAEGVVPFAELARQAFIGMAFLKSMVERGALTQARADLFMQNIQTVAGEFVHDLHQVSSGTKQREEFLVRYGHLRPGTYDILSARYDENPDLYLGRHSHEPARVEPFHLSPQEHQAVVALLAEAGFDLSPEELFSTIAASVAGREEGKFNFTRNVSNALSVITHWGEARGLSRDDLSFLTIEDIVAGHDAGRLGELVAAGREDFALTQIIRLPHLLVEPDDIDVVRLPMGRPTFITGHSITAPTVVLGGGGQPVIDGGIVLIESADPGYDWIFSHGIAGLVTRFGGANSHMAIRSAEFGLPAAIGCGERLYNTLAGGAVIELNCAARTAKVVHSLK